MFLSSFPASLSRSQSFLTRLRHRSRISASVFGQASFSRAYSVAFVLLEIEPLLQQGAGVGKTLGRAALVKIEHGEGNAQVFLEDGVAELGAVAGKLVDVGLNEEELLRIERFQISGRISSPTRRRRAASSCSGSGPAVPPPGAPPGPLAAPASAPADTVPPRRPMRLAPPLARTRTNHNSFCLIRAPYQGAKKTPPSVINLQPRYPRRINFDRCAAISLPVGAK